MDTSSHMYISKVIRKLFPGLGFFDGEIVSYNSPLYKIVYSDGDSEEMDEEGWEKFEKYIIMALCSLILLFRILLYLLPNQLPQSESFETQDFSMEKENVPDEFSPARTRKSARIGDENAVDSSSGAVNSTVRSVLSGVDSNGTFQTTVLNSEEDGMDFFSALEYMNSKFSGGTSSSLSSSTTAIDDLYASQLVPQRSKRIGVKY